MVKFLLALLVIVESMSVSRSALGGDEVPDISKIPQLSKNLKAGTLAWALIDQIHPTQPQTGDREVEVKREVNLELIEKDLGKFPEHFYTEMYKSSIVPVYIGPVSEDNARRGKVDFLGYNEDRTHFTKAVAEAFVEEYGKGALSKPIYDSKGRPLNFILTKVEGNKSRMSYQRFSRFMTEGDHAYLENWSQADDGTTLFKRIKFSDTPPTVLDTTDNPFRSIVSTLQKDEVLGRSNTDFSQFGDAKVIAKYSRVKWAQIDMKASKKDYKEAVKEATKFIKSNIAVVRTMPGVLILNDPAYRCKKLLEKK